MRSGRQALVEGQEKGHPLVYLVCFFSCLFFSFFRGVFGAQIWQDGQGEDCLEAH